MLFPKNYNSYEVLTEAYIGKTGNLKQVEKNLEKVIIMINEFGELTLDTAKFVNSSSACLNAAKLLSKEFGTEIKLNFSPRTLVYGGAYTYITTTPFGAIHTNKEFIKTGKITSQKRFIPIFINVDFNIINVSKLDAAELTGILLHEIGHNIRHISAIYSLSSAIAFPIAVARGAVGGVMDRMFTHIVSLPIINQLVKCQLFVNNLVNDLTGNGRFQMPLAITFLLSNPLLIIRRFDPVSYIMGYQAERYSDSLAAAYGYGPELSRALLKLDMATKDSTYNKVVNSNKVTGFIDMLLLAMYDLYVVLLLDPHPLNSHRIKNTINKLERDLNSNNFPPEVKSELRKDLDTVKEIYKDYLNATDSEKDSSKAAYRQFVQRYAMDPVRNIAFDKMYQQLEV